MIFNSKFLFAPIISWSRYQSPHRYLRVGHILIIIYNRNLYKYKLVNTKMTILRFSEKRRKTEREETILEPIEFFLIYKYITPINQTILKKLNNLLHFVNTFMVRKLFFNHSVIAFFSS